MPATGFHIPAQLPRHSTCINPHPLAPHKYTCQSLTATHLGRALLPNPLSSFPTNIPCQASNQAPLSFLSINLRQYSQSVLLGDHMPPLSQAGEPKQCKQFPQGQCKLFPQGQCKLFPQGQCKQFPQGQCKLFPQGLSNSRYIAC